MDNLTVEPVRAFRDNYIWMLHDGVHAVVVDPGAAEPVIAAIESKRLELTAILLTHLHYDHCFGVPGILARWQVPVIGPYLNDFDLRSHPPFPKPGTVPLDCVTKVVTDGDQVELTRPLLNLSVIATPGHTRGHLVYLDRARGALFTGDTLFAGGCGKVFGGSTEDMLDSLDKLAKLPDATEVYCAHEYTLANLRFALEVEPENMALLSRLKVELAKREKGLPTLPTVIWLERATNPFLRVREPAVVAALSARNGVAVVSAVDAFAELRRWKDEVG